MAKGLLNYIDREQAKYRLEIKYLKGTSECATWRQIVSDCLYWIFLNIPLEEILSSPSSSYSSCLWLGPSSGSYQFSPHPSLPIHTHPHPPVHRQLHLPKSCGFPPPACFPGFSGSPGWSRVGGCRGSCWDLRSVPSTRLQRCRSKELLPSGLTLLTVRVENGRFGRRMGNLSLVSPLP